MKRSGVHAISFVRRLPGLPIASESSLSLGPQHTRLLLRAALVAVLVAVATHTSADPDLFGNIRFGADVVSARSAVVPDTYSFTSAGTFVNHEWLSEALLYLTYAGAGSAGLVVLKLLLLVGMMAAAVGALRAARIGAEQAEILLAIVAITTFPQTNQIRAQLFSLALFAVVLRVLIAGEQRPLALLWLVPIMAVWPNLHGGWIVAAGTIVLWSAIGVVTTRGSRASLLTAAAGIVALLATLANPWGWRMWTFLFETVGLDRADIRDWQPPFRLGLAYGGLWLLVAATALVSVRSRSSFQRLAIVVLLGVASFRVNRLTAFFALATVMLLGAGAAEWLSRVRRNRESPVPTRLATAVAAVVAMVMIAGAATVSARNVSCIAMEEPLFPEAEVASVIAANGLHGRLLNWFDYGHYAIWHFAPAIKVSIDGRRETVYSRDTIQRHLSFYFSPNDRQATIDALAPDYIWIPSNLAVTERLIADGWKPLFQGPQSTLLSSPGNPERLPNLANLANLGNSANLTNAANLGNHTNPANRCFPGP